MATDLVPLPPALASARKLRKLQRLSDLDVSHSYQRNFYQSLLPLQQELINFLMHQKQQFEDRYQAPTAHLGPYHRVS